MMLRVRDASIADLDRLCEIERGCFAEEAFTKRQISQLLTDYNSISLTAIENGDIIGFIIGMIYPEGKTVTGHILTIDVSPDHRRKGIGRMLLQEIEGIFAQKSVQACLLEARENNVAALNLYRKLGYTEIGRLENYYGNAHGICLRKILT